MQTGGLAGRTRFFVVLTIVVLLGAPAGSAFADAETAQFLLKAGKDHLAKKQYEDALARFAKALQQDPSLAEAHYLSAVASDGKKDPPGALEHYRAFLKAMRWRVAEGSAIKAEMALVGKAEARLESLAPGERDLARLDDQYATALLGFARARRATDPAQAKRALRLLLAEDPQHPVAQALLDEIDAGPGGAKPKRPPDDVAAWEDLMADRYFGTADGFTWADDLLTVDRVDASIHWADGRAPRNAPYRFEVEFRLVKVHADAWSVGVGFAAIGDGDDHFAVYFQKGLCTLGHYMGSKSEVLEQATIDVGTAWHHLSIRADGTRIQVWLDAKRIFAYDVNDRVDLHGQLGLLRGRCKAEYRAARIGVPK